MALGRFVITADPAPVPSALQVCPPSSLANNPALATPAMIVLLPGLAETSVRFPHSDCMPARLPVAFTQAEDGVGSPPPASPPAFMPAAPLAPPVPPVPPPPVPPTDFPACPPLPLEPP